MGLELEADLDYVEWRDDEATQLVSPRRPEGTGPIGVATDREIRPAVAPAVTTWILEPYCR